VGRSSAPSGANAASVPPSSARRTRPLARDYGGDARSLKLAGSIGGHLRTIAEHEGALLPEIAEFDANEAWRGDGYLSMTAWLVGVCHVGAPRARSLVDAAHRGRKLPALSAVLAAGRLSFDVFTPLAAVATRASDAELAEASERWTPRQAKAFAADVRGATGRDSAGEFRRRCLRFDDQRCSLWAQLTKDSYARVKAAVIGRARLHDHPGTKDEDYEPFESRCADAIVELCVEHEQAHSSGGSAEFGQAQRRTAVIVHADLDRLLHGDGYGRASVDGVGPISAEMARRLACDADITLSFDAPDGACLDQKPLQRDPTEAQRIEIRRRDQGCRFPGCTWRTVTDVHHVRWVSKQGPTVLSNLLTLCVAHHSRVHELGWKMDGDAQGQVRFISPHGRVLVSVPSPTWRPPRK
jgi:hypothetical protein